jgi:AGZA family xanthine/uracil permease-like MFS transporter
MLERLFKLTENRTNIRTEVIAGMTTFMTMAYIIFVQPSILAIAGMDFGAVMMATCLSAAIATLLMGFYANYPIALAPAMGENFFYVYTVVLTMGISWQVALGAVFLSGVAFFVLTLFKIRELIINAVPRSLKNAIAVGIGFFITFIGLVNAGIIERNPAGIVKLGNLQSVPVLISIFGILVTIVLMVWRVKGAILIGIVATTLVSLPFGIVKYQGLVSAPPSLAPTFMQMDILGALQLGLVTVVTVFLFMAIFDAIGTLIGIGEQAGFLVDGRLPRANRALMSDALGTVVGATLGTSTVTAYIESAAGVEEGGRTGLANVVTGVLFLLAIFFSPVVQMIGGGYPIEGRELPLFPITSPALIIVGSLMARNITKIIWDDLTESFPAFLTVIGMPLTYSIADGLAFGFISYPILKALSGKFREISWLVYLLGLIFFLRYAFISFG